MSFQPEKMWNERFGQAEYAYGKAPAPFFAQCLEKLPSGRMLLPAEGEGRHAVYAAQKGWQVEAFDLSTAGRTKALQLAKEKEVDIQYQVGGVEEVNYAPASFDALALFYAHFPAAQRAAYFQQLNRYLKVGGALILEGFSKAQLDYQPIHKSGGPKDAALLFSEDELRMQFPNFSFSILETRETELHDGPYHTGLASIITLLGTKNTLL